MERAEISIQQWLGRSFDLFKANAKVLIPAGLLGAVVVLLPTILLMLILPSTLLDVLVSWVGDAVFSGPIVAGLFLMAVRAYDDRSASIKVRDVFDGFDFFAPTFAFAFGLIVLQAILDKVLGVVPGLGSLLALVAWIAVTLLCIFTIPLLIDQKCSLPDAVRLSAEKVKQAPGSYFLFFLVVVLITLCGILALGVGLLVTVWFIPCAWVVAYRSSFTPVAAESPAPPPPPPPPAGDLAE